MRLTTFKYIDPDTEKHYYTITEIWDELYDGKWDYENDEKVIEVRLKPSENYLM